jgi:hypothetical protein
MSRAQSYAFNSDIFEVKAEVDVNLRLRLRLRLRMRGTLG